MVRFFVSKLIFALTHLPILHALISRNVTVILAAFGWAESADDELVNRVSANFVDKAIKLSKEMGVNHPYIYSNYAAKGQDVYAGYGAENRQRLREIQKKYDPEEILSRLQPGYFQV
jgi:hypothetical protein